MPAIVDKEKCTACGTCVDTCPVDAISLEDKAVINKENCIDCGTCIDGCPEGAISL
ncbi:MAG: 4Fe-4S binding protein [Candidatus Thermoplasmatota archaeon]|nr:4Fe-4S binding protein [Candidatus Thermoplasmatota archaeon]